MSGEIGEPPREKSDSDVEYKQAWRKETKTRLLKRAKLRKEQSFPELTQKLMLFIKRENLIVQDAMKFFECARESKYGIPEVSIPIRDSTLSTSAGLENPAPNGNTRVIPLDKPCTPKLNKIVSNERVSDQKILFEQMAMVNGKTDLAFALRDFGDKRDTIDNRIRDLSTLTLNEQDIYSTTSETNEDTTAQDSSEEAYEGSLKSLSDSSGSCSLGNYIDFYPELEKQETHFTTGKTATTGRKTKNVTKSTRLEKLISKSLKNKKVARIYLNSLPVIPKIGETVTRKSLRVKTKSNFEFSNSSQLHGGNYSFLPAFNQRLTYSSGRRKNDLRKVKTKLAWEKTQFNDKIMAV